MKSFIYKHPFIVLLHEESRFDCDNYNDYLDHIHKVKLRLSQENYILKSEALAIIETIHYLQGSILPDIHIYGIRRFHNLPFTIDEFEELINNLIVDLIKLLS